MAEYPHPPSTFQPSAANSTPNHQHFHSLIEVHTVKKITVNTVINWLVHHSCPYINNNIIIINSQRKMSPKSSPSLHLAQVSPLVRLYLLHICTPRVYEIHLNHKSEWNSAFPLPSYTKLYIINALRFNNMFADSKCTHFDSSVTSHNASMARHSFFPYAPYRVENKICEGE